jgi:hypothetical protein
MKTLLASNDRHFSGFIERLEGRCCPSCTIIASGGTLLILGDDAPDTVEITDDGAGGVSVECDGVVSPFEGIQRLVVKTRGGDDSVTYQLTNDLTTPRRIQMELGDGEDFADINFNASFQRPAPTVTLTKPLLVTLLGGADDDAVVARFGNVDIFSLPSNLKAVFNAHLGDGDDSFDAFLEGDITGGPMKLNIQGGEADDSLNIYARTDVENGPGSGGQAKLALNLRGQSGNDFIGVDYEGKLRRLEGGFKIYFQIQAEGGAGDDTIAVDYVADTFFNQYLPVYLFGNEGDDNITLNFEVTGGTFEGANFQRIDGGTGFDFFDTNNPDLVLVMKCEGSIQGGF